jgi:hypothetical protein
LGRIAVSSNRPLKGALVLIVIQARVMAMRMENVEEANAKIREFESRPKVSVGSST